MKRVKASVNKLNRRDASPGSVVSDGLCIGCGLCAVMFPRSISMVVAADGFIVPHQHDEPLTSAQLAEFNAVCPGLGYPLRIEQKARDAVTHPAWGVIKEIGTAHAVDDAVRFAGSSGGALTAIARMLLEANEADYILAVGPGPSGTSQSSPLVINDVTKDFSGSRYAPVAPLLGIRQVPSNARVVVIGKPCDIGGLRQLYRSSTTPLPRLVAALSFFCAGTPSYMGTDTLLSDWDIEPQHVSSLRYRGNGWPGRFTVTDQHGETHSTSYETAWGSTLNKFIHNRCKLCADGIGMTADVVAADYWDVGDNGYPVFEDRPGISLVVSRTELGADILAKATRANVLSLSRRDARELTPSLRRVQTYQFDRRTFAAARRMGTRLGGGETPHFSGGRASSLMVRRPVQAARQLLGSFVRARRRRR